MREVITGFATALERGDANAMLALLTEDVTWSMPPLARWYRGVEAVVDFAVQVPLSTCGSWRHLSTSANGQPAVACYLRSDGGTAHRAWAINVLTLHDGLIREITAFLGPEHFAAFGLPEELR